MSRFLRRCAVYLSWALVAAGLLHYLAAAQDKPDAASKSQPIRPEVTGRITVDVKGRPHGVPENNDSVYVKDGEEQTIKKDKKVELNLKTSRDGFAHIPNAPLG